MQPRAQNPILTIKDYRVMVNLGCSLEEQSVPQEISFSVNIKFLESPPGEKTDSLHDTICYAVLCDRLAHHLSERKYNLIEKMANDCLSILRESCPNALIDLQLHKLQPPVANLYGGVTYSCGDHL